MTWKKRSDFLTIREVIESNVGDIDAFLHPKANPFLFHLEEMVQFLEEAIAKDQLINVVADYDCDGVCSAAILKLALTKAGGRVHMLIPERFKEGYGFSPKILNKISEGVIVTVDNGIAAHEVIASAKDKGIACAVIDHHLAPDHGILPDCLILDPHVEDKSEYKEYCGAGLAYRVALELIDDAKTLEDCLIFASIATVADVMPLTGDNRNLVREGLELLNTECGTKGLRMLLYVAKAFNRLPQNPDYFLEREELFKYPLDIFTEEDYGYLIGPLVNAPGRLINDGAMYPYRLFVMDEDEEAMFHLAYFIVSENEERKTLVSEQMKTALPLVKDDPGVVIQDESFHPGIVGILAGKLAEKYHTPAIVFAKEENGIIKGSGRSVPGVHLKNILDNISHVILGYGGHAGAAGLSVRADRYDEFIEAFSKEIAKLEISSSDDSFYDLEIPISQVPKALAELEAYAPFGEGNPKPVFKITDFVPDIRNEKHYRFMGSEDQHVKMECRGIGVNMFFLADKFLKENAPMNITCFGTLNCNHFRGEANPEIMCDDFEILKNTNEFVDDLAKSLTFI